MRRLFNCSPNHPAAFLGGLVSRRYSEHRIFGRGSAGERRDYHQEEIHEVKYVSSTACNDDCNDEGMNEL